MLKHSDIIEKLDILQKAAIISSALDPAPFEQAGIPAVRIARLSGLGKENGVSYASAARSWNPALVGGMTEELVLEAAERGERLFVTPDLKTAVNPYEEGLSEDPYLNGQTGAEIVRAVNGTGAGCGLARPSLGVKQTEYLDKSEDSSAVYGLMLKPFLAAAESGGCRAVFMSPSREGTGYYNTNRAIFAGVQNRLLGDALAVGEGVNSSADAVALLNGKVTLGGSVIPLERAARKYARLKEYEAEGSIARREIEDSLKDGTAVSMEKIDGLLDEIIDFALALNDCEIKKPSRRANGEEILPAETEAAAASIADAVPGNPSMPAADGNNADTDGESGYAVPGNVPFDRIARYKTAAESLVLLKNNGILPLKEGAKISVVGAAYEDLSLLNEKFSVVGKADGYVRDKARSESLIPAAVSSTNFADAAVVFLYPDASGRELALPPNRIALLDALKRAKRQIIAVLCGDMPADMGFDVYADAVLVAPADGAYAGDALARVLCGEINPSGKLTRSLYDRADEYYKNFREAKDSGLMSVGSFTGYRRLGKESKKPRYPFGFGLSYTEFAYSGLELGDDFLSFTLTNRGHAGGSEVAQVYLGVPPISRVAPVKQLRAFRKVFLRAGESKRITIPLTDEFFKTFDADLYAENVEAGEYTVYVGPSSAETRLCGKRTLRGTERHPCGDSEADYFPDKEYEDARDVKKENRFKRTSWGAPKQLRNLHTAAVAVFSLVAAAFFFLVSTLILSYSLDYVLLSVAATETVEWTLYIFAIAMLALCPLLGRFNKKRLMYGRMASIIITPVLITVCFVLGAILFSGNGGTAERVSLRIVTCLAVGIPLFAIVATLAERELRKTKTGNNSWDKYYFTHERGETVTADNDFETMFKAVENARKKKKEIKNEEPPEEIEAVEFYDSSLTYQMLFSDCMRYAEESGLKVSDVDLRGYLAAVFASQLIIVPSSGGGVALCEAVAGYFGKKAVTDNAAKYLRYEDLFAQWRQSANAEYPTNLSLAIAAARRESAYLHTVIIRHVNKARLGTLFLPVAEFLARRRNSLPIADGKTLVLPRNLLIAVELESDDLTGIPSSISEAAAVLSPSAEKCEPSPVKTVMRAVGSERLSAMRADVRDSYPLGEELWKKVDLLGERLKTSRITNRLWVKLETHACAAAAFGEEGAEALDGALAAELMPYLTEVWDSAACGKTLREALPEIFGEGNVGRCAAFAEMGEDAE